MNQKVLPLLVAVVLGMVTACNPATNQSQSSLPSTPNEPITGTTPGMALNSTTNLVSLFLVKKDNTTNQFRGEVYPIAFYINGRYVDASTDVTPEVRIYSETDRLIQFKAPQSLLSAIDTFTVTHDNQSLGQFTVDELTVSQFACSTFLTGQGTFEGDDLSTLYESLPEERSGGFKGFINDREFDESWRWAVATSQYTPAGLSNTPQLVSVDDEQLQQDLLAAARPLIEETDFSTSNLQPPQGEIVVERTAVYDLDRDGNPEVFATLRQGPDPNTPNQNIQTGQTIVYANVWLSYQNDQPTVISSEVIPYQYPVTRRPYDIAGIVDVNGDGVLDVLVQNNGYEATSFSIYEFDGTTLKQVFTGAGYGC